MDNRVLRCKIIAHMLIADGMMTADEKAFLRDCMDSLELTDEERDRVLAIDPDEDVVAEARALPEAERREVVELLVRAALADGKLSPYELQLVKDVTAALGL